MSQLNNNNQERHKLIEIISDMKKDKRIRKAEISEISNQLLGTKTNYKQKNHAFKAIEEWVHRKFDTERRLRQTSGAF